MSVLIIVLLFHYMTLLYFNYLAISYKVVLVCVGDMLLSSSSVRHLEARVRHEHNPLIHLIDHYTMCSLFVHKVKGSCSS
jgi:hypothetical protein